ncbi:MAG: zf-HC2 domain-containing protein [Armatimonadota bacterium]
MSQNPCDGTSHDQELMLYVGGELSPWDRFRVASHLRSCTRCREQHRLLLSTMRIVAAEVRGGALPQWEAQGGFVSASALSSRFHGKPIGSVRLATLAAISAAVAVLTSYMAATYGDRLTTSHFAPLSRVSSAASPPCEVSPGPASSSCRDCASPTPKVHIP